MRLSFYYLSIFFLGFAVKSNSQCNGYESLCAKKYNEVAYLVSDDLVSEGRLESLYRGLVILTFGGGTNEMQRDLITMFGMGFPRADR